MSSPAVPVAQPIGLQNGCPVLRSAHWSPNRGTSVAKAVAKLELRDRLRDGRPPLRGDELRAVERQRRAADDVRVVARVGAVLCVGARGVLDDDLALCGGSGGRHREDGDDGEEEGEAGPVGNGAHKG